MTIERFQQGSTEKFTVIFRDSIGTPITNADGKIIIQRVSDRLYWDGANFVAGKTLLSMTEPDETNSPGLWEYSYTFPNSDESYNVTMRDSSGNADITVFEALAIVGGYVDNINTDMSTLALEASATANTTAINANIDSNEVKIDIIDALVDSIVAKLPTNFIMGSSTQNDKDTVIDSIKTVVDSSALDLQKVKGLVHENLVNEITSWAANDVATGGQIRIYDSKANALTDDIGTGLIAKYDYITARSLDGLRLIKFTQTLEP